MKPHIIGYEEGASSNIRMEGRAIIEALKDSEGEPCLILTDSEFWINVITKWAVGWERRRWTKKGGEIKNLDMVQEAHHLYQESDAVLVWVKAHNDNPGNELADHWATVAREQKMTTPPPEPPPAPLVRRRHRVMRTPVSSSAR